MDGRVFPSALYNPCLCQQKCHRLQHPAFRAINLRRRTLASDEGKDNALKLRTENLALLLHPISRTTARKA
jgi:hypothetical protein